VLVIEPCSVSVPLCTSTVPPEKVLVPDRVNVPVPVVTRLPPVPVTLPAKVVEALLPPVVSVLPPSVTKELLPPASEPIVSEFCRLNVAPVATVTAPLFESALPPETVSVPALTLVLPV